MNELKKKYGLFTAIAMVVGIVIGSGVFFKAEKILKTTGGNLPTAILAWLIGGIIMVICASTFAIMATKYEKVNGIVDYAEVTLGTKYGYYVGWFMATIYYPTLTSALAWLSARYTGALFGWDLTSTEVMTLTGGFLIAAYALNVLSPKLSGKFQVSATAIKLVPLLLMAIVGTIAGLANGVTIDNFKAVADTSINQSSALFVAICATAFAYEGWIIATSINAELKNAKKNLPLALTFGTIAVVIIYILYYIGIAGAVPTKDLIADGNGATYAFKQVFGNVAGTILTVFVAVSCMGTLNGLMLGCTRGMYSLSARNVGPSVKTMKSIDEQTNMPSNSSVVGLLLCALWLIYFYGSNLVAKPWFGPIKFDPTELPIITIYALYIPIFVFMMIKEKDLSAFKRFVLPILAIISSIMMMIASVVSHGINNLWYLLIFAIIMVIGAFFSKVKKN